METRKAEDGRHWKLGRLRIRETQVIKTCIAYQHYISLFTCVSHHNFFWPTIPSSRCYITLHNSTILPLAARTMHIAIDLRYTAAYTYTVMSCCLSQTSCTQSYCKREKLICCHAIQLQFHLVKLATVAESRPARLRDAATSLKKAGNLKVRNNSTCVQI